MPSFLLVLHCYFSHFFQVTIHKNLSPPLPSSVALSVPGHGCLFLVIAVPVHPWASGNCLGSSGLHFLLETCSTAAPPGQPASLPTSSASLVHLIPAMLCFPLGSSPSDSFLTNFLPLFLNPTGNITWCSLVPEGRWNKDQVLRRKIVLQGLAQ